MAKRSTCQSCHRALSVCLCPHIQQINNRWPLHILQHPRETKHAIGTAKIVQLSLQNCQTTISKKISSGSPFEKWLKDEKPLLIYPGEQAEEPEEFIGKLPRTLLVIDASWRKSRRMLYESPQLQHLQRLNITPRSQSRYRIRKVPAPDNLSTLEAVVEVLSALEDNNDKYQPLLNTMDWMINKQIEKMGPVLFEKNYNRSN